MQMEILGPSNGVPSPREAVNAALTEKAEAMAADAYDNFQNYLAGKRDSFHFHFDFQNEVHTLAVQRFTDLVKVNVFDKSLPVVATDLETLQGISARLGEDETVESVVSTKIRCTTVDVEERDARMVRAKIRTLESADGEKQSVTYYGLRVDKLITDSVSLIADNFHG
jgi:hypothetical protein